MWRLGKHKQPATDCGTLQHTAAHCNTLQHTATHCGGWGNTDKYDAEEIRVPEILVHQETLIHSNDS